MKSTAFTPSFEYYKRRESIEVVIGAVPLGAKHPIRIQSMTTIDTMDTIGSIEQCLRMVNSGCEYIRITAPSIKEAQNLAEIKKGLKARGAKIPLIADIHFTPNAAEVAAEYVEKVRVNPGNYADKKKFDLIEYDDDSYQEELDRIKEKFLPLVDRCKAFGTAIRIGTNHGSLSDRIMSRYGDTPLGMVESALEFIRICEEAGFDQLVVSMKSSNPQVMIQAYRLLVAKLNEEGLKSYPLHLGVTEAGEGEDGRIKSALGIGTLLEDGIGDTIRVSLTEEPEFEAPIARVLAERYTLEDEEVESVVPEHFAPFEYKRRKSKEVLNIGGENVPRVISDLTSEKKITKESLKHIGHSYLSAIDKWGMGDLGADYVYSGDKPIMFMLPNGLKEILNLKSWKQLSTKENKYPLITFENFKEVDNDQIVFAELGIEEEDKAYWEWLLSRDNLVIVLSASTEFSYKKMRSVFMKLEEAGNTTPVVVRRQYNTESEEKFQLFAATDLGGLLIDGYGDGSWLKAPCLKLESINSTSFSILQAARTRMTKTEYISCPSCGRTLFDLQETTAMIRKRTDHLKGIKIGIMGCIVNGPGEMADADYGYVGSGKGKITLYKGQEVIQRSVPSAEAVDQLIELIKDHGDWIDPN